MPKEQGHCGEPAVRSTSKTNKDKSNSATLRASQGGTHRTQSGMGNLSNRFLRCDSEKDSGYSEAGSDSVNTDVDDQHSSVSEPHNNNNNKHVNAAALNKPPYEEMSPVYVVKNLVVKPSGPEQLLAWGGGWHSLTNAKATTRLLLIQQPTMPSPAPSTQSPSGPVAKGSSHISKNSYLPILNSYPRIAPHPRKEGHEAKPATWVEGLKENEGQSQSKRVCTEEEKRETQTPNSHFLNPPQQHHKDGRVHSHLQSKGKGPSSFPSHASSTQHHQSHRRQQGSDNVSTPSVSYPSHASTTTQHQSQCRQQGSNSMGSTSVSYPSHTYTSTTTQHQSHRRQQGSKCVGTPSVSFPSHTCTQHQTQRCQQGTDNVDVPSVSYPSHISTTTQHQSHRQRQGADNMGFLSVSYPSHVSSTTQHQSHHCPQGSNSMGSTSVSFPSHTSTTTTQHQSHRRQQGSNGVGSPSVSSSQTTLPPSASDSPPSSSSTSSLTSSSMALSPHHSGPDSSTTRRQRFLNTTEILNQSGLLAITLRTKELLKHNASTEREIAQLRQHTDLLCQVAQANQNGCNKDSEYLDMLLLDMMASGCYPDLDINHLKALSSSSSQHSKTKGEKGKEKETRITETQSSTELVGSVHNRDEEISPPSPLFAPSPDSEQREAPLDAMSILFPQVCP